MRIHRVLTPALLVSTMIAASAFAQPPASDHETQEAADTLYLVPSSSLPAVASAPPLRIPSERTQTPGIALVGLTMPEEIGRSARELPGPTWRLPQLEQMAMENNPAIAAALARIEAARGHRWQAGLRPNPNFGYLANDVGEAGQAGRQGVFVGNRFITGHKLQYAQAVADQQVLVAEQEWAVWTQRVLTDVRLGYYDVLIAQRRVEVTEELTQVSEATAKIAGDLVAAMETSRIDVLQAQVEWESNKIRVQKARNAHVAAWRRLSAVLGISHLEMRRLEGDIDLAKQIVSWEDSLAKVHRDSPELAVAHADLQRAQSEMARALAQRVPDVTVQASVQHNDAADETISGLQVGVPLMIFDRNQGAIAKADAEITAAQRNIEQVERDLERRLATVYRRYADSRFEVDKYVNDIRPRAKESLELASRAYRAGETGYLVMLTSQRTYFQTDLAYIEALHNLWQATLQIEGLLLNTPN